VIRSATAPITAGPTRTSVPNSGSSGAHEGVRQTATPRTSAIRTVAPLARGRPPCQAARIAAADAAATGPHSRPTASAILRQRSTARRVGASMPARGGRYATFGRTSFCGFKV